MKRRLLALCVCLLVGGLAGAAEHETMHTSCTDDRELAVVTPALRLLTLNSSHGRNTAMNQVLVNKKRTYENLDAVAEMLTLAVADVVALQEADAPSRWSGGFDHVRYVAERAVYPCIVHGLHSRSWISTYGTALLSRAEIFETGSVRFAPSPPSKQKGYVHAQLLWHSEAGPVRITLASVHFDFLSRKVRENQVMEMVSGLSQLDGPLIVLGDLNSEWLDDTSHVRLLAEKLNLRAFDPEGDGLGTYKKPTGKRLDWILISQELEFRTYKVLPEIVADHFAVYAEIIYSKTEQQAPASRKIGRPD